VPTATAVHVVTAPTAGYVTRLDAFLVGRTAWQLGAGRARKEHPVSAAAGVVCAAVEGDRVEAGQPLLELHLDDPGRLDDALATLIGAIEIRPEPVERPAIVIDTLTA